MQQNSGRTLEFHDAIITSWIADCLELAAFETLLGVSLSQTTTPDPIIGRHGAAVLSGQPKTKNSKETSMPNQASASVAISSHHIGVAAEAFAAGQFARCGFDVSVQYGANQPEYDLMVAREATLLKISVKGSQDGGWGLTQSFLKQATKRSGKKADYHGAIDIWLERHGPRTVLCLVQFAGVPSDLLPRLYLATPKEVAKRLHETAKGRGDSILYENQEWTLRAHGAGTVDKIPDNWRFTRGRVEELLENEDVSITTSQTLT